MTEPDTMSTASQISTLRKDTSACASSGFVRRKSSFPSRTSSTSCCMFGWIAEWITPPRRICTPTTTSSSDSVHPFSVVVCEYTSARTIRPTATASNDWKTAMKKFARYCISFRTPSRR